MIRGKVISLLLLATFLLGVYSNQFEKIHLSNVERTVNLAGQYPTEIAKLTLHANEDEISHFSYLVLLEFDSKISRLFFVKSGKDKNSLAYTRSVYIYVIMNEYRMEDHSHIIVLSFLTISILVILFKLLLKSYF